MTQVSTKVSTKRKKTARGIAKPVETRRRMVPDSPIRLPDKIEHWPLDRVIPYPNNPRKHDDEQIGKIAAGMIEYDWTNPILVDEAGIIIAGHGRRLAAIQLAMKMVPVIRLTHLTEVQKRAYRLADNRLTLDSQWDNELLQAELRALEELDYNLELTGFDLDEIGGLLETDGGPEPEAPLPPEDPVTTLGDLWILGSHRLLCGNSSLPGDVDRLLAGAPIHLVNTDPPSSEGKGIGSDYLHRSRGGASRRNPSRAGKMAKLMHHQGFDLARGKAKAKSTGRMRAKDRPLDNDFLSDEAFEVLLNEWFGNMARVLLPGRGFYIWGGYANVGNYPPVLKACGLYFSQAIIWVKEHPVLTRKDFMGNHEWCFYGWREGAAHRFYGPTNAVDVWPVKKVNPQSMIHLTEKPVELALRAIHYSSKPRENVLDLFGGSGSTLIAAEQATRQCFMMELDPAYCDVIIERWQTTTGQKAVLEGEGSTFEKIGAARKRKAGR